MRLRRREFRAKVHLQHGDLPIIICLGPGGLTFESTAEEAHRLASDIADALEQLRRGGPC
jgi:hypothetical protein